MADQEVKIRISTDASQAISGMRNFEGAVNRLETQSASLASRIKSHWLGLSAAVAGAAATVYGAWDLAKQGADILETRGILDNLAKSYQTTASIIVSSMAEASENLIANSDLARIALGGLAKGLNPEQLIELSDAARILGDSVGKNATDALNDLTEALETGRMRGLKQFAGSAIDLKDTFGELESKLTAAEKAQAMYALIMIHATDLQKKQTTAVSDTADKFESLETKVKNVKDAFAVSMSVMVARLGDYLTAIGNAIQKTAYFFGIMDRPSGATRSWGDEKKTTSDYQQQVEDLKKTLATRVTVKSSSSKADNTAARAAEEERRLQELMTDLWIKDEAKKWEELEKWEQEYAQQKEKEADLAIRTAAEKQKAERDLYQDLRGYENSFYAASLSLVESQTAKYRELKIDEVAITAWAEEEKRKATLQLKRTTPGGSYDEGWKQGAQDWTKGVGNMFTAGEKMAKTTADSMSKSFSSIFFDAAKGELKDFSSYFKSFSDSILKAFTDMLADMAAKWAMESIFGSTSGGGGLLGAGASLFSGFFGSDSEYGYANGAAFSGGRVTALANGGIVSRPTLFPMANGMGLMGEAGPEAVMPLKRTSSGKLGVVTEGGGGGGLTLNVPINISGPSSKAMISEMRSEIEETAIRVLKRHS
jgi:lambda family phage tail tape measure protein